MPIQPSKRADKKNSQAVRLQRVLAAAGVAARRVCEQMIEEGRVRVNGRTVRALPVFVNPAVDRITVDGRPLARKRMRPVYIMVNKPERMLTTVSDEPLAGRATVMDLVTHPSRARLFPAGRLDWQTCGLVLLTNDGELVNRLTHPRYGVPKVYRVLARGTLDEAALQRTRNAVNKGLRRDDRRAGRIAAGSSDRVELATAGYENGKTILRVTTRDGRVGDLAAVLSAAGVPVRKVERMAIGPLELTGLARGRWRELERGEVRALKAAARGKPAARGKEVAP